MLLIDLLFVILIGGQRFFVNFANHFFCSLSSLLVFIFCILLITEQAISFIFLNHSRHSYYRNIICQLIDT